MDSPDREELERAEDFTHDLNRIKLRLRLECLNLAANINTAATVPNAVITDAAIYYRWIVEVLDGDS